MFGGNQLRSPIRSSFGQTNTTHISGINKGSLTKPITPVKGNMNQPKSSNVIVKATNLKERREEKSGRIEEDFLSKSNIKNKIITSPSQGKIIIQNQANTLPKGLQEQVGINSKNEEQIHSNQKFNTSGLGSQQKIYIPNYQNFVQTSPSLQSPQQGQQQQYCTINLLDSSSTQQQNNSNYNLYSNQNMPNLSNVVISNNSANKTPSPILFNKNIPLKSNGNTYLNLKQLNTPAQQAGIITSQTDNSSSAPNKAKIDLSTFSSNQKQLENFNPMYKYQPNPETLNKFSTPSVQPQSQSQKINAKAKTQNNNHVNIENSFQPSTHSITPFNNFNSKTAASPYQNQIVVPFTKDQDSLKGYETGKKQQSNYVPQSLDKTLPSQQFLNSLNIQSDDIKQQEKNSPLNSPNLIPSPSLHSQISQISNQDTQTPQWSHQESLMQSQQQQQHFVSPVSQQFKYQIQPYSPLDAYQFLACEEGAKRAKLNTFQQKLQIAKRDFEGILSQFQNRSEISMNEYHSNISFLERTEQEIRDCVHVVTSQLKETLLSTFNQCLAKCKGGQFEVSQMLQYLTCTENDLMSNIECIIKDMDMDSLEDIVLQYETVIKQYEETKEKHLQQIQYTSYQMKNKDNQSQLIYFKDNISQELIKLLNIQQYSNCILSLNQNCPDKFSIEGGYKSNFSAFFNPSISSVTQNNDTNSQKFNNNGDPKSIFVSFENKDIFNSCTIQSQPLDLNTQNANNNESQNLRTLGNVQNSTNLNPISATASTNNNLINTVEDNIAQTQSPSFKNTLFQVNYPTQQISSVVKEIIEESKENKSDQKILNNNGFYNISNHNNKGFQHNNKLIQFVNQANINLTSDTNSQPLKIEQMLDHQYKLSGGSIAYPSTTTNTISEVTSSLAQTHSSGSRAQSEKVKGIFEFFDQFDAESKQKNYLQKSEGNSLEKVDEFQLSESQYEYPSKQLHPNGITGYSQYSPHQTNEETEKILKESNNILKSSLNNKQKYNMLLQKIQVNQSQTEKLYSDVLQSQSPPFKYTSIDSEIKDSSQRLQQIRKFG